MTTLCNRVQLSTGGTAYLLLNYKKEDSDGFLLSLFDGNNVWKGKCKNYILGRFLNQISRYKLKTAYEICDEIIELNV